MSHCYQQNRTVHSGLKLYEKVKTVHSVQCNFPKSFGVQASERLDEGMTQKIMRWFSSLFTHRALAQLLSCAMVEPEVQKS